MTRKTLLQRLGAFALLVLIIGTTLLTVTPTSSITLQEYAEQCGELLDPILTRAIADEADALEAAGDTESAALMRGFDFYPFRLGLLDGFYYSVYVDQYTSVLEAADEMAHILATSFYLDRLTTPEQVTDALVICYARAIGDKYASYVREEDYFSATEEENGNYVGIGVTVEPLEDGYAQIIEVTHDSPAEEAGIIVGDVVVAVGEEDFAKIGYDDAIDLIRGEEGTSVTITVLRGDERLEKTMIRKRLVIHSVSYRMLESTEDKIGFVRISSFDHSTFSQFVTAIETLEAQGATSYIFDVRRNPGGNLDAVLAILEYILPDNTGSPIVRLSYKDYTENLYSILDYYGDSEEYVAAAGYSKALNHSIDKKMAVLCDSYTISAGELFTSCLKDFGVAELYGEKTYGKGMGQSAYRIQYDYWGNPIEKAPYGVIRISTFYYAPPVSANYDGIGVIPHHFSSLPQTLAGVNLVKLTEEQDTQLQAAVAFLESDAPLSPGKVTLPSDSPDSGDVPEADPPEADTPTDVEQGKSTAYKAVFWILFGVIGAPAAALLIGLAVYRTLLRRKEDSTMFFGNGRRL